MKTKNLIKNLIIAFIVFLAVAGIFSLYNNPEFDQREEISLTTLAQEVEKEKVKSIEIEEDNLKVELSDGTKQKAQKEVGVSLLKSLEGLGLSQEKINKVDINVKDLSGTKLWVNTILPFLIPVLLIGGFIWFMMRGVQRGNRTALSFGKSNARQQTPQNKGKKKTNFLDVAGCKEAKEELKEVVDFLSHPRKYLDIGARIPKGVMLIGPPGTGKTLLARAVAGEANVPFFHISGSEFVEMFVGVGASTSYDTNILIRQRNSTKLLPIGKFVDRFYKGKEEGLKKVQDVQTLGIDFARGNKFFKSSNWKKIKAVYRHKVDKIYKIQFIGGSIEVTGDHSVFIRNKNHIICKRADKLKTGDILVGLPYGVRGEYNPKLPLGSRNTHLAKAHSFPKKLPFKEIVIWSSEDSNNNPGSHSTTLIPGSIAKIWGLSDGHHVGVKALATQNPKNLMYKVRITPGLMKLMGYYTAEGDYHDRTFRFSFGAHEKTYHRECIKLVKEVFNLKPNNLYFTKNNAVMIQYNSESISQFFVKYCGQGAHNKHIPGFIWDLPKKYFVAYLEGLVKGDGYINKRNMIELSSVSEQLISELRWLLNMHGIPCSVTKYEKATGHRIKKGKPLPKSTYWRITIARLANPLSSSPSPRFFKRPIIKKITVKPYNGFVYDLCGAENEAFFGGQKPILLHNSRVRDLFHKAKKAAPAIVFVDEIDAVGRQRGAGLGGSHDEREQTLNQILVEMDGFEQGANVIVMAATNRPDVLDPALLRPGRFDRRIVLDLPDIDDRSAILKVHIKKKPLDKDVNLREIAERTPGFSGADLANLVNEAAISAARKNKKKVGQKEFLESIERVLLGPERKSHVLSKKEKKITAYHEAGHALAAYILPHPDPVHKVSIVSRGRAAGYTLKLPSEDKKLHSKSEFLDELAVFLAGYASEKIVFNELTTGATNDLKEATRLARRLVTEYGMSETLGPMTFGEKEELVFLGRTISEHRDYGEKIATLIDEEVRRFIEKALKKAQNIIKKNRARLELIAQKLIKDETIERKEFKKLMKKSLQKTSNLKDKKKQKSSSTSS